MNLVVTVDENWAIGRGSLQLTQIPAQQRYVRNLTAGGIVIMGHKTLLMQPQGIPWYGCKNMILSRNPALTVKGAAVVNSMDALRKMIKELPGENIYICGGESIYKELLPDCDTAFVTFIEKQYDADRYIPNLEKSGEWTLAEESDEQTYFDITYYFRKYVRK